MLESELLTMALSGINYRHVKEKSIKKLHLSRIQLVDKDPTFQMILMANYTSTISVFAAINLNIEYQRNNTITM